MNSPLTSRSSGSPPTIQLNLQQRTGPLQPQHFNTIDIPKAMLTAPFLQYSALTPGQKRFLCSMCKAYSKAHMRKLMQQHYLNVLHRSIRTGLGHNSTQEKEISDGNEKGQEDKSTSKKMTVLPKINSQQKRSPESDKRKSGPRLKKKNHGSI